MSPRTSSGTVAQRAAAALESAILALLADRGEGKTICPSEVARAVAKSQERTEWHPLMKPIRDAAMRLARSRQIVIMQRGQVVDGNTAKGPIRFARR